jgi:hypothetical protein
VSAAAVSGFSGTGLTSESRFAAETDRRRCLLTR